MLLLGDKTFWHFSLNVKKICRLFEKKIRLFIRRKNYILNLFPFTVFLKKKKTKKQLLYFLKYKNECSSMTADCKRGFSAHQIIKAKKNESHVSHLDFLVLAFIQNWISSLKDVNVWDWVKTLILLQISNVYKRNIRRKGIERGTISHAFTKQDRFRTPWRNGSIAEMTGTLTSGSLGEYSNEFSSCLLGQKRCLRPESIKVEVDCPEVKLSSVNFENKTIDEWLKMPENDRPNGASATKYG